MYKAKRRARSYSEPQPPPGVDHVLYGRLLTIVRATSELDEPDSGTPGTLC